MSTVLKKDLYLLETVSRLEKLGPDENQLEEEEVQGWRIYLNFQEG